MRVTKMWQSFRIFIVRLRTPRAGMLYLDPRLYLINNSVFSFDGMARERQRENFTWRVLGSVLCI